LGDFDSPTKNTDQMGSMLWEDVGNIGGGWIVKNKILDGGVVGAYCTKVEMEAIEALNVFNYIYIC